MTPNTLQHVSHHSLAETGWRAEHSIVTTERPNTVQDFPCISIVISTLGRRSVVRTIESVVTVATSKQVEGQVEIIVCADLTADLSNFANMPSAKLIVSSGSGANCVRNAGARQSRGSILWFLDDDTEVFQTKAIESLQCIFDDPLVLAAGGEYVSDSSAPLVENGYNALCAVWRSSAGSRNRELLLGGTLAVRRSVFDAVGGFDEAIKYGGTETSFVQRIHSFAKSSERVVFDHRLDVIHRPSARTTERWLQIAAAQSRQKRNTKAELPKLRQRFARAFGVIRRLNLRSQISFIVFGVPFIAVSRFVALTRR